jgi:ribosome-associated protein
MAQDIEIPGESLVFKFSRSSGPGGQNVNKVSSKVTLFFDINGCGHFTDVQKGRILTELSGRVNKDGFIKVVSQKFRTQQANRRAAVEKLKQLLAKALEEKAVRKKTKVPQWAKQKRLESKRKRSTVKQLRAEKGFEI